MLSARGADSMSQLSRRFRLEPGCHPLPTAAAVAHLLAPRTDGDQAPERLESEESRFQGAFRYPDGPEPRSPRLWSVTATGRVKIGWETHGEGGPSP